jgi:DNA recombination protein RmuC
VQSYNHTVRSLETRVLVTARRFSDLGVTGEELPSPEPLDTVPRRPQATELVDPGIDAAQVAPLRSTARRAWDATVEG